MNDTNTKDTGVPGGHETPPVAVFRNSLRQWQARWKARQAFAAAAAPSAPDEQSQPKAEQGP